MQTNNKCAQRSQEENQRLIFRNVKELTCSQLKIAISIETESKTNWCTGRRQNDIQYALLVLYRNENFNCHKIFICFSLWLLFVYHFFENWKKKNKIHSFKAFVARFWRWQNYLYVICIQIKKLSKWMNNKGTNKKNTNKQMANGLDQAKNIWVFGWNETVTKTNLTKNVGGSIVPFHFVISA